MLVERNRQLPISAVRSATGIPFRRFKARPMSFCRIRKNECIEFKGGVESSLEIINIISRSIRVDMYISDPDYVLTDLLVKSGVDKELRRRGVAKIGKYVIMVGDKEWTIFSVRDGNEWGRMYAVDWNSSPEQLESDIYEILDGFGKSGWSIDRISAPIKMFEQLVYDNIPSSSIVNISSGAIDAIHLFRAWNCFRGGRMEAMKLGSFKNVFDYDLNSAYFSILEKLPSLKPGFFEWVDSKEYIGNAEFGFCKCRVYIDEDILISPIAVTVAIGKKPFRSFFPVGESVCWRTKEEIDFIRRYDLGDVDIIEGSWAIPLRDGYRVFSGISKILRSAIENHSSREYAKYIASISWGKFASQGSPLWNPIYASFITSRIRCLVTQIALLDPENVIAITVDGVLMKRDIQSNLISNEIGSLKVRPHNNMWSLSDYYRYDPDQSREGYTWSLSNNGITVNIRHPTEGKTQIRVPFGSTKRIGPKNLDLSKIKKNQYELYPPTPEEAIEIYMSTQEFLVE